MTDPKRVPRRHLALVGMMGVGKTTIGKALAERLNRAFFDSDAQILVAHGYRTVREIFLTEGESVFRKYETEALKSALDNPAPAVIAAAGGIVLQESNRRLLTQLSTVIWLRAPVRVLVERVKTGNHRPLLEGDPEQTLYRLWAERAPLYAVIAKHVIDVEGRKPDEVVDELVKVAC